MHKLVMVNVTPGHQVILGPRVYDMFAKYRLISKGRIVTLYGKTVAVTKVTDMNKLTRILAE